MADEKHIMDETEDDAALSMVDILEAEEKLQEDANAVLGGSDDRNCTYLMGYVDRQALYSCKTCATEVSNGEPAGVCLACSLECHEGHELIELYTKRNFRCDCGNDKFGDFTCKLCPKKQPYNPDNKYNQNYSGLYCSCLRPYPDPDDSIEDEMIQCVVCEDWFHKRHVASWTVEEEFDEMICGSCMDSCNFLWSYAQLCNANFDKKSHSRNSEPDVNVVVDDENLPSSEMVTISKYTGEGSSTMSAEHLTIKSKEEALKKPEEKSCCLQELKKENSFGLKGAVFWPEDWRKKLCRCTKCLEIYEAKNVCFLLDENDTIAAYEERGKSKAKTSYQQGLEALSKLNHVQQVDLIQEYNDLKSHLTEYLKKFAENKKVVRQEDVNEFFTQMAARKRQKSDTTLPLPYYCK